MVAGEFGQRNRMLKSKPAAGPHLHFVTRWEFPTISPVATACGTFGSSITAFNAADVHSCIFERPVSVLGKVRGRREFLDPNFGQFVIIAASCLLSRTRSPATSSKRVLTVAPMPPEKMAYALARYSRSPDSIRDSVAWVRTHDSTKFLESFYFQYGHASIADLGHLAVCFEGISELAATEIEDEQLWDGQARSSRYQDFSNAAVVVPPELNQEHRQLYCATAQQLLATYRVIHEKAAANLSEKLPRPADMKPEAYARNIAARAFDVARYLLPFGIPTGVGQVTSIRTLERQVKRLKASEFAELREIADELAGACAVPADCVWDEDLPNEAVAPTLARHAEPDEYPVENARSCGGVGKAQCSALEGACAWGRRIVAAE